MSPITKGDIKADQGARKAAQRPIAELSLFPSTDNANLKPDYSSEEKSWAVEGGGTQEGPWIYIDQKLFLPQAFQWKVLKALHDFFHIGRDATTAVVNKLFTGRGLTTTIKNICQACSLCSYNNPG